jgi:hypothetical protein
MASSHQIRPSIRCLRWVCAAAVAAALCSSRAVPPPSQLPSPASDPGELAIGIRSGVDLGVKSRTERAAALADPARKRPAYAVIYVQELPSAEKIAQPVNARAIGEKLMQVLDAQGFRRVKPGQRPEIVIGAKYCRGYLSNPYSYKQDRPPLIDNLTDSDKLVNRPPFFEPMTGLEDKAHRAALEKLILMVVAWKYPPPRNPKEEVKPLWRSTMTVDDPDHRDLNAVAGKMLEAAAPFFDRELDGPEVIVTRPLPEGRVKLGEPTVLKDPPPAPPR